MKGRILVISSGPGDPCWIPPAVSDVMRSADVFIGYRTYLTLVETMFPDIPRIESGMRQETDRTKEAIDLALNGKTVAMISGGDASIYGMAGLVLEMVAAAGLEDQIDVEIFPGITALSAAAALLGAPLMTDFAAISLSDQLTPLDTILQRVKAAAKAGFVLCFYNPCSHTRSLPFIRALEILNAELSPDTPVGVVKDAFRSGQEVIHTDIAGLPSVPVSMNCIIIVGNKETYTAVDRMITPRGYRNKYPNELP